MKRYKYILLLFVFTSCFISCEKEIEFKGPVADPLLVMNGMLSPDSVVSIHLSQSRFVIGEKVPFSHISKAKVSLFVNNKLKEQLSHSVNGIYKGTYFPKTGDEIKIEVSADKFNIVTSQTRIPKVPVIVVSDSIVTLRQEEDKNPDNTTTKTTIRNVQLRLKLKDIGNEENYYFIKASQSFYNNQDKLIKKRRVDIKLTEVLKNNIIGNSNVFQDLFGDEREIKRTDNLFSDQFVDGKDIIFDFSFFDTLESSIYANGKKIKDGDRYGKGLTVQYMIEIGEISKDLYNYLISANKAMNSENYGPFTEPVIIYSNIENGIGILGSYNIYRFFSRFKSNYLP